MPLIQTAENIWTGRADSENLERYFQRVICQKNLPDPKPKYGFIGFASDTGIMRNQGRIGAKEGPNAIRKTLGKLACHLPHDVNFWDLGNIICEQDLESAQRELSQQVDLLLNNGVTPIVLGGGHETAFGHYLGISKNFLTEKIGIINFDAHLDLRSLLPKNLGTSGTPFWQIALDAKEKNRTFDYCCIGLQKTANTSSLLKRADDLDVKYFFADEVRNDIQVIKNNLIAFIKNVDVIYLTICLDVFSQSVAPGVSAPQPLGLMPEAIFPLLEIIRQQGRLVSFDIVELSPPYDKDGQTAALAACLIDKVVA